MGTIHGMSLGRDHPMTQLSCQATVDPQAVGRHWMPGLDRLGIAGSLACAIHCLIAPFLMLLIPALGTAWSHPSVHWALAGLVLPLALTVIYRGYRVHRRRSALVAAVLGSALLITGLLLPEAAAETSATTATCTDACCPTIAYDAETQAASIHVPPAGAANLAASALLILAHGINLHGCRCFRKESEPTRCECAG